MASDNEPKAAINAAIVYDFDGTLSPGSMQDHSFIPNACAQRPEAFWSEVKLKARQRDGDEILTYMQHMISCSRNEITMKALREHGSNLPLFQGVPDWFDRMNGYAQTLGMRLDHFIVSSGIKEMIDGCSIANSFKHIFASSFSYDVNGNAEWPAVAINYTTKTQFLFRINKGIHNSWDNAEINRWVPPHKRPVPFERIIFIGDGDTDIPSMKMVRFQGGTAIAVFDPANWQDTHTQEKIYRLISEDRANYVAPADYTHGSQLDVTVRGVLGRVAANGCSA